MNQKLPDINGYCFNPGCLDPRRQELHHQESHHVDERLVCPSCGSNILLADRYRAVRLLGQGGMSRTFLSLDQAHTPPMLCVIKQVWRVPHSYPVEPLRSLLQQEEWSYPHLPRYLNQFEQNGVYYQVQDYTPGENLAAVLAEKGAFQTSDIWQLLEQMLPAIQQLHQWGILHGDIKPENIICRMPEPSSQPGILDDLVLVDMGVVPFLSLAGGQGSGFEPPLPPLKSEELSGSPPFQGGFRGISDRLPTSIQSNRAIGSPAYAAPEQLNGKPQFASDLYSLGVTCIHLFTGIHPFNLFDLVNRQWIWQNYKLPDPLDWSNQSLVQFLDRLIAPDLSQRLSSAAIALTEMQKLRGRRPVPVPVPAAPVRLASQQPQASPPWNCSATLTGHSGLFANINAVAIAPDGRLCASASDDKTIRLWQMQTGQEQGVLSGHTHFVKSVAFHPHHSTCLVSGGRDRSIYRWDLQTRTILQTLNGHHQSVNVVLFSPDGAWLASGSADKTVNLWDACTGKILTTLKGHTLAVTALTFGTFSHNGGSQTILASASADSTVRLWDLTTGESLHTLTGHTAAVRAIAFSPDSTWLATGSEDRTIRLWDVASRQCCRILTGHPWAVSALAVAADGKTLISGSWDKTVNLWQIASGQRIATLEGHTDSVSCVAIAPDQRHIISGSYDKTLKLWQLESNG